mmetsp:Transcript_62414/g.115875  ORF Transcript_62414/g.115875 Transcript_62414/m.115875 type:complete len:100 (+) Transcript_62414:807-1106(+)
MPLELNGDPAGPVVLSLDLAGCSVYVATTIVGFGHGISLAWWAPLCRWLGSSTVTLRGHGGPASERVNADSVDQAAARATRSRATVVLDGPWFVGRHRR